MAMAAYYSTTIRFVKRIKFHTFGYILVRNVLGHRLCSQTIWLVFFCVGETALQVGPKYSDHPHWICISQCSTTFSACHQPAIITTSSLTGGVVRS